MREKEGMREGIIGDQDLGQMREEIRGEND